MTTFPDLPFLTPPLTPPDQLAGAGVPEAGISAWPMWCGFTSSMR